MPLIGFYRATKWAVEALHESLAQEVKAFGIKVTLIEPGAYATEFGKSAKIADGLEAYADFRMPFSRSWTRKIRRCDLRSVPGFCRGRVPYTLIAYPPGKRGRTSRTQRKAGRRKIQAHRSSQRSRPTGP
jgi:NAD(P)-dependent dehydrogenase (short-subunit alcohol dehydrogenase family)